MNLSKAVAPNAFRSTIAMVDIRDAVIIVLSGLCMVFLRVILNNPINKIQEVGTTNNPVPDGDHGDKDTLTIPDMHDDQDSTAATQVEMPMQPAKTQLNTSESPTSPRIDRLFLKNFVRQNMN